jgi:hypothetical protein
VRPRIKLICTLLAAAMFAGTGHAANETRELRSSAVGVDVVYEIRPTSDFRAFLAAQPPGSVAAIALFEPPAKFSVVAKIRLTLPAAQLGPSLQFATTYKLANGANVPQSWRIDNATPGRVEYKAIFGLPQDVVGASTALVSK